MVEEYKLTEEVAVKLGQVTEPPLGKARGEVKQ